MEVCQELRSVMKVWNDARPSYHRKESIVKPRKTLHRVLRWLFELQTYQLKFAFCTWNMMRNILRRKRNVLKVSSSNAVWLQHILLSSKRQREIELWETIRRWRSEAFMPLHWRVLQSASVFTHPYSLSILPHTLCKVHIALTFPSRLLPSIFSIPPL